LNERPGAIGAWQEELESPQYISGLGLTPGTYTWTWGSGATADSLEVNIPSDPSAVPAPSSLTLAGTALFTVLGYFGWRRVKLAVV
jgi:hypothetical protein